MVLQGIIKVRYDELSVLKLATYIENIIPPIVVYLIMQLFSTGKLLFLNYFYGRIFLLFKLLLIRTKNNV